MYPRKGGWQALSRENQTVASVMVCRVCSATGREQVRRDEGQREGKTGRYLTLCNRIWGLSQEPWKGTEVGCELGKYSINHPK